MTSCPPLKAKVSVSISSKAVVTIWAPSLSPKSVVGLSVEVTVRVDHRQNIPSENYICDGGMLQQQQCRKYYVLLEYQNIFYN